MAMENHQKSHMTFNCSNCEKVIPHNSRSMHIKRCKNVSITLSCEKCPYITNEKSNLNSRGDHGDPLVQNSLGGAAHSVLWGNIRHFCKRDFFWNSMWTQHNGGLVYKGICSKIQRKNWHFSFFAFFAKFFMILRVHYPIDQFVWSIRFFWYPYWHTLWHFMSYGMCHKLS